MPISVTLLGQIWSPEPAGAESWTEAQLAKEFSRRGISFFEDLDGEFALCAELTNDEFFLVRDPLGLHPLYFLKSDPRRFSGYLADLREGDPELDTAAARSCLRQDPRPAEGVYGSPEKGRLVLAPGNYLHVKQGKWTARRYWAPWKNKTTPRSSPPEKFRSLLASAVAKRAGAANKLALSFSGGLDSASLAAATLESGRSPYLISYRFKQFPEADESLAQEAVCKKLGLPYTSFFETDLVDRSPQIALQVETAEMPLVDPLFALYKEVLLTARAAKATFLLTGHWGDQVMFPLDALWDFALRGHWRESFSLWRALKDQIPEEDWGSYRRYFFNAYRRWMKHPTLSPRKAYFRKLLTSRYHVNCLEWNFKMRRRFGVSVHHPFLDRNIIEYVLSAPPRDLFGAGPKTLLKNAFTDVLPERVLKRQGKADFSGVVRWIYDLTEEEALWEKSDAEAFAYWTRAPRLATPHCASYSPSP